MTKGKAKSKASKEGGSEPARIELANRLFFRLYQCANMLHKTGTRAEMEQGLEMLKQMLPQK